LNLFPVYKKLLNAKFNADTKIIKNKKKLEN